MSVDLPPALPPQQQEVLVCAIPAADQYKIPVTALLAVADTEGGKPGQWVKNTNGTFDVGSMQFNTSYLKELEQYGISVKDVEKSGCYPYYLASWRISNHIKDDKGDFWRKVANYHSKTPEKNAIYQAKLIPAAAKWDKWLKASMMLPEQLIVNNEKSPPLPKDFQDTPNLQAFDIKKHKDKITFAPIPEGTIPDEFKQSKKLSKSSSAPIVTGTGTKTETASLSIDPMKSSSSIELPAEFIKLSQN